MKRFQESPAFTRCYDLLRWLIPQTERFPRSQRFVLARAMNDAALQLHAHLAEAVHGRRPIESLAQADVERSSECSLRVPEQPSSVEPQQQSWCAGGGRHHRCRPDRRRRGRGAAAAPDGWDGSVIELIPSIHARDPSTMAAAAPLPRCSAAMMGCRGTDVCGGVSHVNNAIRCL